MKIPSRVACCLVFLLSPLAACSDDGPSNNGGSGGEAGATGGGGASDDGTYHQGVYTCCGEGKGLACCPPGSLPDPDTGQTATCFQYGGVVGACTPEGEVLEGKDICALCCGALVRIDSSAPSSDGSTCEPTAPPSVLVCAACGDGACGLGENACNCPDDCQ
ncbi:MAG: hypothetical protein U0271_12295 [Polyangiaceae bacterium]